VTDDTSADTITPATAIAVTTTAAADTNITATDITIGISLLWLVH
jgi:hypothetical protein